MTNYIFDHFLLLQKDKFLHYIDYMNLLDGQIVLISQTYGWTEFEEGTEVTVAQFKRGYFTWYRYQADWDKHTSQMHHGDICPGIEYVDAWMPLPSPYTQE